MIPFNKILYDTGKYDVVTRNNLPVKDLEFISSDWIYPIRGTLVSGHEPQHTWMGNGNFLFNQNHAHIYDLFLIEKDIIIKNEIKEVRMILTKKEIMKVHIIFNKSCYVKTKEKFNIHYNEQILEILYPELIMYSNNLEMGEIIKLFKQDEIDQIKISREETYYAS